MKFFAVKKTTNERCSYLRENVTGYEDNQLPS